MDLKKGNIENGFVQSSDGVGAEVGRYPSGSS